MPRTGQNESIFTTKEGSERVDPIVTNAQLDFMDGLIEKAENRYIYISRQDAMYEIQSEFGTDRDAYSELSREEASYLINWLKEKIYG